MKILLEINKEIAEKIYFKECLPIFILKKEGISNLRNFSNESIKELVTKIEPSDYFDTTKYHESEYYFFNEVFKNV